ncbi:U6 snRNA phosphodiesterase [Metarhizium anisopliae]|nr:U6 snRNA phosphodiesterase [Metarhizium anisopliae]
MGLVDYSSSSDDEAPAPPKKRLKGQEHVSDSKMPPLPEAFYDLYASTVRQSVVDDPSLHQGRTRLNPHVAGNWPTHLYIEWHPTEVQHGTLDALIKKTQQELGDDIQLHSFLNSDLGTDLPLHISLSRPLSLPTSIRDDYLTKVKHSIRSCGTGVFSVKPVGLAWYKSPDSDRTFFVVRIAPTDANDDSKHLRASTHPELMMLLTRCNTVAAHFDQPPLYQQTQGEPADTAFHISIGWTLGAPDEETRLRALKLFRDKEFEDIHAWNVKVDGVKAKIGNVVTHIPLLGNVKTKEEDDFADSLYGS